MANMKALRRAGSTRQQRRSESINWAEIRHKFTYFQGTTPVVSRLPLPLDWHMDMALHHFDGDTHCKKPKLCPKAHYGDAKCPICPKKNSRGFSCKARDSKVFLHYNANTDGETYERGGKKFLKNPFELIEVQPGEDDMNWAELEKFDKRGVLNKRVITFQKAGKAGMLKPALMDPDEVQEDYNGARPPKDRWAIVREYTFEDVCAHILNACSDIDSDTVDFDYFGVEKPEVAEDEDPEVDSDEDDDESSSRKRGSKKSKPKSARRRSNDEDDESPKRSRRSKSEEEEEDEDEDEDEAPTRKRPSRRDDEDEDEDEESTPRRRRKVEVSDDEQEDDDAPPRRRKR